MRDKHPEETERAQLSRRKLVKYAGVGATLAAASPLVGAGAAWADEDRRPGDDDKPTGATPGTGRGAPVTTTSTPSTAASSTPRSPPMVFHKGADAVYPIVTNAIMAKNFGLTWAMCTDHGGPTHSKVNIEQAYPDLLRSRKLVPEVLQFWGMEFDAPSLDHHTLMIPRHDDEAKQLFELESRFAKYDAFPTDPARDTEAKMVEFLKVARGMPHKPLVIAHHASRSAPGLGVYGQDTPREFRNGNNAAPDVYIGFEGAPGHQAGPLNGGERGGYGNHPTYGGFDQMTAGSAACGTHCSARAGAGGSPRPRTRTCTGPAAAPTSGRASTARRTCTPARTTATSWTACATAGSGSPPAT